MMTYENYEQEKDYMKEDPAYESLVLEPDDWSEEEWKTILKMFNMKAADRIVISNYMFEAIGVKNGYYGYGETWKAAIDNLFKLVGLMEMHRDDYGNMHEMNQEVYDRCRELHSRYRRGERTKELLDDIISCNRSLIYLD